MAEYDHVECREALDFATEFLLWLKENAPNTVLERRGQRFATGLQLEYGLSDRAKRLKILEWMRSRGLTNSVSQTEARDHFAWRRQDISELFSLLLSEDPPKITIIKEKSGSSGSKGGRPATRYRLTPAGFAPEISKFEEKIYQPRPRQKEA